MNHRVEVRSNFPPEQDGVILHSVSEFIAGLNEKNLLIEQFLGEERTNRFFQQIRAMEVRGKMRLSFSMGTKFHLKYLPGEIKSILTQDLFGELSTVYLRNFFFRAGLTVLDRQQTAQWLEPALKEVGFRSEKNNPANKSRIRTWQKEEGRDWITIPDGLVTFEWAENSSGEQLRCILSFIDYQMAGQENYHFGSERRTDSFRNLASLLTSDQGAPIIEYLGRYPPPLFGKKPCYCSQPKDLRFHFVLPEDQNVRIKSSGEGRLRILRLPLGRSDLRGLGNALIKDYYKIE